MLINVIIITIMWLLFIIPYNISKHNIHPAGHHSGRHWAASEHGSRWWSRGACGHDDRVTSHHVNTWMPRDKKSLNSQQRPSVNIVCLVQLWSQTQHVYILTVGGACWQPHLHGSSAGPAEFSSSVEHSKPVRYAASLFYWFHTPDREMQIFINFILIW